MPCYHWVSSKAWTTPTTGLFKSPTSPFYYHEATPSSSTTTSTPSSITASTSTSTQLIVDLSMVTKVMVTGVKVGPHTTGKDFCDKYMRVDVVADNYETPYLLKMV